MVIRSERVLTETYRDKIYEKELTDLYFDVMKQIQAAKTTPSIEFARVAYSAADNFIQAVIFSKHHMQLYQEKVVPVMTDIKKIIYGNPRLPSVQIVSAKYNARIVHVSNKQELENGILVIDEISQAVFLVKQWAYDEGLFLSKPIDRKYGLEGVEEALEL